MNSKGKNKTKKLLAHIRHLIDELENHETGKSVGPTKCKEWWLSEEDPAWDGIAAYKSEGQGTIRVIEPPPYNVALKALSVHSEHVTHSPRGDLMPEEAMGVLESLGMIAK